MRRAYVQACKGTLRQRGYLGDVAVPAEPAPPPTLTHDAQVSRAMLEAQQAMVKAQQEQALWQKRWTEADLRQRYFQIAAILAVPLAGVFWRWFLGSRTASRLGLD